jgi:putative ABC transport system substrate-binding protein
MRVGMLYTSDAKSDQARNKVFVDTMRELGWVEGANIAYDRLYADGDAARLQALAAKLIARKPDLVLVSSNPEVRAVLAVTRAIPVIFSGTNNPVATGLVKSLARPGGNVTGIANIGPELGPKRVQLLREAIPGISRVGLLITPLIAPLQTERKLIEETAARHLKIVPAIVNEAGDLEAAFKLFAESRVEAVITTHIQLYDLLRKKIIDMAAKYRLPVIGHRTSLAEDGALMSYSSVRLEQVRRAAHLVDKVLKGTNPADVPVEQPTKFELVINMKTAKALGITIPQSILLQASRVIE